MAIGQILGGWLVSADLFGLGWRFGFFINLPICLLLLALMAFILPETRAAHVPSFDVPGMLLFCVFLLCLLLPVALGARWHALRWMVLGLAPVAYTLWRTENDFEARGIRPLLPPSFFRTPMVMTGLMAEAAVTFGYSGFLFVTALCLQSAIGFDPLQSGNSFCSLGVMFFFGSLLGKHVKNSRAFLLGSLSTILGLIGCGWSIVTHGIDLRVHQILFWIGMTGLGNALMVTSALRLTLLNVSPQLAGEASATFSTVQQGCFALGTALAGALYSVFSNLGFRTAFAATLGVFCGLLVMTAIGVLRSQWLPMHAENVSSA